MASGFKFEGMDALMEELEKIGKVVTKEVKDKALRAGAEVVRQAVENHPNVPKSDLSKRHAKDNFIIVQNSDGTYDIGVADEFFYLFFHEVGASSGTYELNGVKRKTPAIQAKPFLRPSLENSIDEVENAMIKTIRKEMGML